LKNPVLQIRITFVEIHTLNLTSDVLCATAGAKSKFSFGNAAHLFIRIIRIVRIEPVAAVGTFWGASIVASHNIHFAGFLIAFQNNRLPINEISFDHNS